VNIVVIIIASIIVIAGALARPSKIEEQEPVLGETATVEETPTPTPQKDANLPTITPTPTLQPPEKDANLLWQYPNSSIITKSETALILESNGDVDAITDWYKEKIKAMGMNAKSFVVTKTNGNVLNKLVGDNGNIEIRVEISKSAGESTVRIVVTYHTS